MLCQGIFINFISPLGLYYDFQFCVLWDSCMRISVLLCIYMSFLCSFFDSFSFVCLAVFSIMGFFFSYFIFFLSYLFFGYLLSQTRDKKYMNLEERRGKEYHDKVMRLKKI